MSVAISLRPFKRDDCAALAEFWVAAWRATGIAIDFDARRDWFAAHLTALAAAGVAITVAEILGTPVGFATLDPRNGDLDQLCVAPERQGRGIARALLDDAMRRAPGGLSLKVNQDNPRARRLYERSGFVVTGASVSLLSGLPILLMEWRSDQPPGDALRRAPTL